MASIKILNDRMISQIAAGEVIERPAAVVKELMENAIDAFATEITVTVREGGKILLMVQDNGIGMNEEDLVLSVRRHATSKMEMDDLSRITTLGFRGEALASIASISRLKITSRQKNDPSALSISVEGGENLSISPASHIFGTTVSIQDLFYAVPARLKFLKSTEQELTHIKAWFKRLSLSHPFIAMTLINEGKRLYHYPKSDVKERIHDVLGSDFSKNHVTCLCDFDEINIFGFLSIPTYNCRTPQDQYFFLNNRFIRDKILTASLRVAYEDLLSHERHPMSVIFLNLEPHDFDINVHPMKCEARFANSSLLRKTLISTFKEALISSKRTSTHLGDKIISIMEHINHNTPASQLNKAQIFSKDDLKKIQQSTFQFAPLIVSQSKIEKEENYKDIFEEQHVLENSVAIGQFDFTYVLAETEDGLVLIDQHAAHERIVYEKLKKQFFENDVETQGLLISEIFPLKDLEFNLLKKNKIFILKCGIDFNLDQNNCVVTHIPALLSEVSGHDLVSSLLSDLEEDESERNFSFVDKILKKLSTFACHTSIRSGKKMSHSEIQHLIFQMNTTLKSAQCNHGRPTYILLKKKDINRLFERT